MATDEISTETSSATTTATISATAPEYGDGDRIDQLISEQEQIFLTRHTRSKSLHTRASRVLAGGVTSNWQIARPEPVFISRGEGSKIYDVDENEYVDLHGGYGAGLAGHAHPAIVEAVSAQVRRGTHFAQPSEDAVVVAEELSKRFGLPKWRYMNSGTEATMDAVHLMRAVTGRDLIIKIEGCYHGHHDSVQVSVAPYEDEDIGSEQHPSPVVSSTGIPTATTDLTLVATYNDLESVRSLLEAHRDEIAGMILEPVMMNAGIVEPDPGYLEGLRSLLHEHGALLCFDEVKTGLVVGPGGVTAHYGVTPDIICLAKALGGGLIAAALGATDELMAHVADGDYEMVGTFNGNPLSMAAARAMLEQVTTPEAYARLATLRGRIDAHITAKIEQLSLSAHVVSLGAKGCVTFSSSRVRNYRDFLRIDDRYNHLHWLVQMNGGVFLPPWGKTEQWLVSVQHTDEDIERFLTNFDTFAELVAAAGAAAGTAAARALARVG